MFILRQQCEGKVDMVVVAAGTGGIIISCYLHVYDRCTYNGTKKPI